MLGFWFDFQDVIYSIDPFEFEMTAKYQRYAGHITYTGKWGVCEKHGIQSYRAFWGYRCPACIKELTKELAKECAPSF